MYALFTRRSSIVVSVLVFYVLESIEVSAWIPAAGKISPKSAALSFQRSSSNSGSVCYSTLEDKTEPSPQTTQLEPRLSSSIVLSTPKIKYTVPGMKRGWKENGVWMDEDGPRNGPPQNFWRQMGDERLYDENMQLVNNLLKLNTFDGKGLGINTSSSNRLSDMISGMVEKLEKTNSIRIPSLNRLILGNWAPIVRGGQVVAASNESKEGKITAVSVPYRFHVQRTGGQKLAHKTPYGQFDEHLEPEEELTIRELSSDGNTVSTTSSGVVNASGDKYESRLVKGLHNASESDSLYLGAITYVTKYLIIMRRFESSQEQEGDKPANGPVTEIWIKVDSDDGSK
ncbi:unnamed protein product [Pseudo-nitzschia multistriata]|uniref:Plastid lipid-associated protein/fibrillin conserved domain-containing protein n=1 Tax=Pseudo-nitzschia multistriata TaxID=183589 RepID=A0A448ZI40_9STRA|nr:unnamed protein product [Pseudo-nitzschia multistriata]